MRKGSRVDVLSFVAAFVFSMAVGCSGGEDSVGPDKPPVQTEDTTGTVTDIDGNVYKTVKIGDQWWMAENLKVARYRNGDSIHVVTDNNTWASYAEGACCGYDNDPANIAVYGRLYNWNAVNDSRNIAPEGWRVPSDADWGILVTALGGAGEAGGKMKEEGTAHWDDPNEGATNSSGFTALGAGQRGYMGSFIAMGQGAYFWSATQHNASRAYARVLDAYDATVYRNDYAKDTGYSIRCVKD